MKKFAVTIMLACAFLGVRGQVVNHCDTVETNIVAASISKQEVCLFHTQNEQERDVVFRKKIEANI